MNIQKLRSEFKSWEKEYDVIQKKYESLSIFEKIKCYFGFYEIEGKAEAKEKMNDIYRGCIKKVSLKDLHEFFDINNEVGVCSYKDPLVEIFARKVTKCHFREIQNKEESIGFTWKVTNKNTNVIHYIVGTSHAATKKMTENPSIKEAIENTKMLITEIEGNRFIFFLRWLETLLTGSKTNCCIDDEMTKHAMQKNHKIVGLETFMDQLAMP